MSRIHFLNVLEGDCNIIEHDSGRVTVIDVSNADDGIDTEAEKLVKTSKERALMKTRTQVPANKTNYRQKETPDNPISYLKNRLNLDSIFRFILTHPDMDHLDGIKDLFGAFPVTNFWDTNHTKTITSFNNGGYNKEDWAFYLNLRKPNSQIKRLTYHSKANNNYYSEDDLHILAPTPALIKEANDCGDFNDCSYVLLFTPPRTNNKRWKILFAGDSHDKTWNYILGDKELKALVSNIDILFAPHHGRDSNRSYEFLDVLKPTITLFGNASHEHLAYSSYPEIRITNNQAGHVILDVEPHQLNIYVENKEFANDFRNNPKRQFGNAVYDKAVEAWFLGNLKG